MAEANPNQVTPIKEGLVEEVKAIDMEKTASVLFDAPKSDAEKAQADAKAKEAADAKAKELADAAKKTEDDPSKVQDSKADETKKEDAPVELKDFTLPKDFVADAEIMTEFKNTAKELKLSQEQAQKLVDMQTKLVAKQTLATQEQWNKVQSDWRQKAEADKEIGGKDFKANIGIAKTALEKFGTKELKDAIEFTGMGNHPELIRFLHRVGKAMSEDKIISGNRNTAGPKDLAKTLFPSMN